MTPVPRTRPPTLALGNFLRSAGLVQDAQLRAALERQHRSGEKLGDALSHVAAIDAHDTDTALMVQQSVRAELAHQPHPAHLEPPACLRVGELLVAHGDISRTQLDLALQQLPKGTPLGALLVQMGALSAASLDHVLSLQKRLLSAVLHAGVGISFAFVSPASQAGSSSAQLIVSATVATSLRMSTKSQPGSFTVTAQDIARGYTDVLQSSEIAITTNSPTGVALEFHAMDSGAGITAIQVRGGNSDFRMEPSGGIMLLQGGWRPQVQRDIRLFYRLWLGPNAQTGTYAWPLTLSATAL